MSTCSAAGSDAVGAGRGRWASAGRGRRLCHRAWQQASHSQDTRVAGSPPGGLPEQVAYVLAHGFAQLTLERRIGCGEGLSKHTQIVSMAELVPAVGTGRVDGGNQAHRLLAEQG